VLIEGVLRWVGSRKADPWRILDLGTGSGCLLIALLHELKAATGVGVDIAEDALSIARSNAVLNHVEAQAQFILGNWGEDLQGPFDIIVSNPPYIPLRDKQTLPKSVLCFDPPDALFGGEDGLASYHILTQDIRSLLAPEGLAVLEMGQGQVTDVTALFQNAGFNTLFVLKDLAGIERAIGVQLKK
jgi:release factor glutamine methyltransferase